MKNKYGKCIDLVAERQICLAQKDLVLECSEEEENMQHCLVPVKNAASGKYLINAYYNDRKRAEAEGISKEFQDYAFIPRHN